MTLAVDEPEVPVAANGETKAPPQPIRLPQVSPIAPVVPAMPFVGERDAIRRALESVLADGAGVAPM